MFVLSERAYEFLKRLVELVLPAIGTLYFTLAEIWGWPGAEQVLATLAALATFLGVILRISSHTYDKLGLAFDGDMIVEEDQDGAQKIRLALTNDADVLAMKDSVSFRKISQAEQPVVSEPEV